VGGTCTINLYEICVSRSPGVFDSSFYSGSLPRLGGGFFDFYIYKYYTYTMKKFPSVEDYIEVINGDRDIVTGKLYGLFDSRPPIISLARYDVKILDSMSQATQSGRALTDKQAELAVKIVLKYRKQLAAHLVDVSPVETPTFRLGIRQIDRRRLLYIDNNSIMLKFPYDTTLINDLRDLAMVSQGSWKFDSQNRSWALALTEMNVVAANGFAQNHKFELAPEFERYIRAVEDCESQQYEIKLIADTKESYTITNAARTLIEAVNDWTNLEHLIDRSAVYGYTVDEPLVLDIVSKYGPRVANLMTTQETKFAPTSDETVFQDLVRYADTVGRYPIYVYEPDMSERLYNNFVAKCFDKDDIYRTQSLKQKDLITDKKVVYFNKFTALWDEPIPLLISGQGMMHGGDKTILLQRAEKVVYFATEVYNVATMKRKN